jgi:hypothetical protein
MGIVTTVNTRIFFEKNHCPGTHSFGNLLPRNRSCIAPFSGVCKEFKFACIDTAGEIISSSATDTLSASPHRIVHRGRLLAKLVKCYEVIATLRSGLPSHDLSSVRIV